MSKPPMFFLIIVAIIAVLASRQYMKQKRENAQNDASLVRSIPAEVASKREYPWPNERSRQREWIVNEQMRYEALFRPLSGASDITVIITEQQYAPLQQGMQGVLQMQGTRYVGFTPRGDSKGGQ